MESGSVVSWGKQVGDPVCEGDILAEIETDKAVLSVDATDDGYVAKILVPAGTKNIPVGSPLLVIVPDVTSVPSFKDFKPASDLTSPQVRSPVATPAFPVPVAISDPSGQRVLGCGRDPHQLLHTGSGVEGCVVVPDLERTDPQSDSSAHNTTDFHITPHYYLMTEVEIDQALSFRETALSSGEVSIKEEEEEGECKNTSLNDIFIKATALANKRIPACNSAWMGHFAKRYTTTDVCISITTPMGLVTPVIFNADAKGLLTISQEVRALIVKAQDGRLEPQELLGGTITISNLGLRGISLLSATINPLQSCTLSIGAAQQIVVPDGHHQKGSSSSGYKVVTRVSAALCCDHRVVVDASMGATWLREFKNLVETPGRMLL